MRSILATAALLAITLFARPSQAEPPMPTPLDDLDTHLASAFTGTNLLLEGSAFALTGTMAFSGADHAVRLGFQRHLASDAYGDTANLLGYAIPAVSAPLLWLAGIANGRRDIAGAGSAAIQALAITLATTGALKVITGRGYPAHGGDPSAPDRLEHPEYAHEFKPFQNGLAAWPSGHTASTISIVAALTAYLPESPWVPLIGYPLGLAIGVGMVDGDRHWASDVISGAVFGHVIGYSVGRNFRRRIRGSADGGELGLQIYPMTGPATGIMIGSTF
ncbi:MAG TPA: phosphatase PAP2 family protein [Polyangiaceae bacterium]|nr:phosphatase PAP2 family protein [Polyangiaceae bacterium]